MILLQGISELIKCIQTIRTGVDHRYKQGGPQRTYLNHAFPLCGMTSGIEKLWTIECTIWCRRHK